MLLTPVGRRPCTTVYAICCATACMAVREVQPPYTLSAFLQASKGRISLMSMLLQAGARVNARDATGSSPLHRYVNFADLCHST